MSDPAQQPITFQAPDCAELAPLFPGYAFHGLIATGGMGAVYRAVQKSLDRMVAIKILPQEFSQDCAFTASFEAEAKAMARLNHPNLIGVYDFGEINGMLFIIMEFVPGKSLYHSAHGLAIDPAEVIRLVTGICSGLAHAHNNGILHRDIKPSNILLDLNARPKIGDFGLARPIGSSVDDGEEIFGTPHYTAPEVCSAPQCVSHRADIFSVGVMLHELLTGRLPADYPYPASSICQCDPRFDVIIRRATDPMPDLRYASAEEIARDLQAIAAPAPVALTPALARPAPVATQALPRRAATPAAGASRPVPVTIEKSSSPVVGIFMLLVAIIIAAVAYKEYGKPRTFTQVIIDKNPAQAEQGSTKPPPAEPPLTSTIPSITPTTQPSTKPPKPEIKPSDPEVKPVEPEVTTPDPVPVLQPKYDVAGFLTRARKIMQDRAEPLATKRKARVKDNFWTFEKESIRLAGRVTVDRVQTVNKVTKLLATMKSEDSRVPASLDSELAEIPGIPGLHEEMLDKQKKIDQEFRHTINELAATYIVGLNKQIERLKTENDPAAITLIEEEITKTRNESEYFPSLILGSASAAGSP